MGFLAIFGLLLGWDIKLDSRSILERGLGSKLNPAREIVLP